MIADAQTLQVLEHQRRTKILLLDQVIREKNDLLMREDSMRSDIAKLENKIQEALSTHGCCV